MSIFNKVMSADEHNNYLMKGINDQVNFTSNVKLFRVNQVELKNVIKSIVCKFTELMKKNHMAAMESLFRFPSREMKELILNNYEYAA